MPHHFTKSTEQAMIFCPRCMKETMWKIADGRRQFCLPCQERKQQPEKPESPQDTQGNLFN
jgi:hypothetical protein